MDKWVRNGAAVSNTDTAGFLQYTKQRELAKQKDDQIQELQTNVKTLNDRLDRQELMLQEILRHVQK